MISFEDATSLIREGCRPLPPQRVSTLEAVGRFLWDALVATEDGPRSDRSAVDGYGVRVGDLPGPLRIAGRSEAGSPCSAAIGLGECVRLLTGAVVPPGVEAVAMQEDCRVEGETVLVVRAIRAGSNVRWRGEEHRAGEILLPAQTLVTPAVAGYAAAQGLQALSVGAAPRVMVVSTGNELLRPGEEPRDGMIYASNATTLLAALRALGLPAGAAVVGDDRAKIRETLSQALESADLVVTTGGVSVGDCDFVRECVLDVGVRETFWKVAMKPGKPVFFGHKGERPFFGLPGSPVAAMVVFQTLVRPAILSMMGAGRTDAEEFPAVLAEPLRKRPGRTEFVRVRFERREGAVYAVPTRGQGSHMISGMATADGLVRLPREGVEFDAGESVSASTLRWGLV